eukprot:3247693-Rhodomonas_salina.2
MLQLARYLGLGNSGEGSLQVQHPLPITLLSSSYHPTLPCYSSYHPPLPYYAITLLIQHVPSYPTTLHSHGMWIQKCCYLGVGHGSDSLLQAQQPL